MKKTYLLIVLLGILISNGCKGTGKGTADTELNGDIFIVTKGAQTFKLALVEVMAFNETDISPIIQSKVKIATSELDKISPQLETLKKEIGALEQETAQAVKEENERLREKNSNERVFIAGVEGAGSTNNAKELENRYLAAKKKLDELRNMAQVKKLQLDEILVKSNKMKEAPFYMDGLPQPIQTAKTDADGKFSLKLKPGKYALVASAHRQVINGEENYYWLVWASIDNKQSNRIMLSNDNLFETHSVDCIVK